MRRVFELSPLNIEDFCRFSLVCHLWFEESLPIWRKNVWVKVLDEETSCNEDGVYVGEYLKLLEESQAKENMLKLEQHKKFIINNWSVRLRGRKHVEKLKFWKKVGPMMSHLRVQHSVIYELEDFRKMIFKLTKNLQFLALKENAYKPQLAISGREDFSRPEHCEPKEPQRNLKELHIVFDIPGNRNEHKLPISWIELMVNFPNIQVCRCHTVGSDSNKFYNF